MPRRSNRAASGPDTAVLALLAATTALVLGTVLTGRRRRRYQLQRAHSHPDSAPEHARRAIPDQRAMSGSAVLINRPRQELYAFWRDVENLPRFMDNVREVRADADNRWEWTIAAPAGYSVTLLTEMIEERAGELIAWRTLPGSDVEAEGRIVFRDAPSGRGTIVKASVAYRPPAGEPGRWIAKLFRREPEAQGQHELRRFKMLMETGEIATSANHKD